METELSAAMTAGVYIEFVDAAGTCVGQRVFLDWRGRALPSAGDQLACEVCGHGDQPTKVMRGRVRRRDFEVQTDARGEPEVWARLVVDTAPHFRADAPTGAAMFSAN